ncbi:tRNA uridine-5-carboxymethylaminomethyl(34) synthesis GTPase MnmE [Ahrensia marina]|uniref:tRNA modification GTPase MnmE n=1 Tax=Ahrensia marina TaxID=1514904 RepID=A0A0N0VM73_9HYPH|nr:tRNA uridine-5-carboxymethylaminomethyl(34) synthesis GTPase MnmE [Ahrensia marina]KPB02134.1 hypothetical protein SU32_05115 [Ahrensia marina]
MDTIVALSSGSLPSGVAIIRISGPKASKAVTALGAQITKPRQASLQTFYDPDGSVIDEGLVLWFPSPHSFTGEDVVELQTHGSRAVVAGILDVLSAYDGVRHAEAGEFARRAFTNGKIDLTEAEGLADLIDAETTAQRKVAQYLATGGLKELYKGWQDQLLNARAMIEADIDFADEDDVPGSVADQVWQDMAALQRSISHHLEGYDRSERIRDGFKISLVGKPNVGKSSLLNALAGSDRAIVSSEAGTTRDVVEVRMDIAGYLVLLSDTAGIREQAGAVEAEGIRRSIVSAEQADLVLYLSDDDNWDHDLIGKNSNVITIRSKADLGKLTPTDEEAIHVSVNDSASLLRILDMLSLRIKEELDRSRAGSAIKSRYIDHLHQCLKDIKLAIESEDALELRAEHLRAAAYSLGRITGQYDTEDVLGRIFSSFCIGK